MDLCRDIDMINVKFSMSVCVGNYINVSDQQHNLHHVQLEHVALPYVIFLFFKKKKRNKTDRITSHLM